jgi:hypothetical protein
MVDTSLLVETPGLPLLFHDMIAGARLTAPN